MPPKAKPTTIHLITHSREELWSLSRLMAVGLPWNVMDDKDRPLIVSVRGSLDGGKKVVSDSMRAYLIGSTALSGMTGNKGYDEFWRGHLRGRDVEINYIDAAWLTDYSNPDFASHSPYLVRQAFLAERDLGGVSFVQNDGWYVIGQKPGLEVWLEKQGHPDTEGIGFRAPDSPLGASFREAHQRDPDNEWLRFVEIRVSDERLLSSGKFVDVLDKVRKRYGGVTPGS